MLKWLLVFVAFLPYTVFAQKTDGKMVAGNDKFVLEAFNKADEFMNEGRYDSAQVFLNKIYQTVSYRRPSLFSYFLTSRQAEVYYYNNLHDLGLLEAYKAENIAKVLKDSLLLSDAYNFIGLFNLSKNRLGQAEKYFKLGLKFAIQPPYKKRYIELSKPHHIYGNLAESFEKSNMPDSAIYYCRLSIKKARQIASERGEATGTLNLGMAFLLKHEVDSAFKYFEQSKKFATEGNDFDVELTSYGGLAHCASIRRNKALAFAHLDKGFALLKQFPQTNSFYLSMFLDVAVKLYRQYNDAPALIKTLELRSDIQKATYDGSNTQIQSLLLAGLKNEKTIFGLELNEVQNKQSLANTRSYIAMLVLLVIVIAFIAYRYYALQRLKLANVRSKISQDLHDEVGATLSGIVMYSYITKEQIKNAEPVAVNNSLDIIKDNAAEMVAKLNDIVWAVNPVEDQLSALIDRLKEYAVQLASVKNVKVIFNYDPAIDGSKLPMETRKNVYLICKEAVNNSIKYSDGTLLTIRIAVLDKHLYIDIEDNGKGFVSEAANKGNGLQNMRNRAIEINGVLTIQSAAGTKVSLSCKIT